MADGSDQITQDEIEALLRQAQGLDAAKPSRPPAQSSQATAAARSASAAPPADDIELLLRQAEEALASVDAPSSATPPGAAPFHWHDFGGTPPSTEKATLELLRDVELELKIELGRTQL